MLARERKCLFVRETCHEELSIHGSTTFKYGTSSGKDLYLFPYFILQQEKRPQLLEYLFS
jgi:hypothetical protein